MGEKRVAKHLYLRHNRYYVVWKPPAEFRYLFGNVKQKKVALGSDLVDAKLLASRLVATWKLQVQEAKKNTERSPEAATRALDIVHSRHHEQTTRLSLRLQGRNKALSEPLTNNLVRDEHLSTWESRSEFFADLRSTKDGEPLHLLIDSAINMLKTSRHIAANEHTIYAYNKIEHDYNHYLSLMYVSQEFSEFGINVHDELKPGASSKIHKTSPGINTSMIERWCTHQITQHKNKKTADDYASRVKKFHAYLVEEGVLLDFHSVASFLKSISPKRSTLNGGPSSFRVETNGDNRWWS